MEDAGKQPASAAEQAAEQSAAASAKCIGERPEDRGTNRDAGDVGEDAVSERLEVDFAAGHEAGDGVLGAAKGAGESAAETLAPVHRLAGIAGQLLANRRPAGCRLCGRRSRSLPGGVACFRSACGGTGRAFAISCGIASGAADGCEGFIKTLRRAG